VLNVTEADQLVSQHLGTTPRATHSRFVAHVMQRLAKVFGAHTELWAVVGLCHDLDFFQTADDRSQHGILTVEWLGDLIPPEGRSAIASHDHRSGVHADTLLADALKIADVMAVVDAELGRSVLLQVDRNDPLVALRGLLADKPHLCDMLEKYTKKRAVPLGHVLDIVTASSLPSR
jgi:hypothetical protein